MQDIITVIFPWIPPSHRCDDRPAYRWYHETIGIVVPAPLRRQPEDDPLDIQQCPRCLALITVEDFGINFCDRCNRLIFVDDDLRILSMEQLPMRCPRCNATLENGYDADYQESQTVFCRECGHLVDGVDCESDGYQFSVDLR